MDEFTKLREKIRVCNRCPFNSTTDVRYTGGTGIDYRVMFIAESPSTACGTGIIDSDQNFTKTPRDRFFLEARRRVGLENSYITDIVKCGVPNGKPSLFKLENCLSYLKEEIILVNPNVIVAVGKTITLQNGNKRITYNFADLLQRYLGNTIPITWIYHYSWIYRYHRHNEGIIQKFKHSFEGIKRFL